MANGRWDFQNISDERRANLDVAGSFQTLTEKVRDTMEVLCCHNDPCDRAAGFKRPVYTVRVSATGFDLFYLTKLKIMGAFLNYRGDEFIADRKRRRHCDLHETGWS